MHTHTQAPPLTRRLPECGSGLTLCINHDQATLQCYVFTRRRCSLGAAARRGEQLTGDTNTQTVSLLSAHPQQFGGTHKHTHTDA